MDHNPTITMMKIIVLALPSLLLSPLCQGFTIQSASCAPQQHTHPRNFDSRRSRVVAFFADPSTFRQATQHCQPFHHQLYDAKKESVLLSKNNNIILPSGESLPSDEFDSLIERFFDLKGKFEVAQTATGSTPTKQIPKKASVFDLARPLALAKPILPSESMTGVSKALTEICATLSNQMYDATSIDSFQLTDPLDRTHPKAKVVLFDDHGMLKEVTPPMAVALSGNTLILSWRGSATFADWVSDFSYVPVGSSRWSPFSNHIKTHSGFTSLVESDLAKHEATIVQMIRDFNITQLITTGHSLAGGMSQVAHIFLEGQVRQEQSLWHPLRDRLTIRSLSFAAPMTVLSTDLQQANEATNDFLQSVANNSCNVVCGCDVVPHSVGDIRYMNEVIESLLPELATNSLPKFLQPFSALIGLQNKLLDVYNGLFSKESASALFRDVLIQYSHVGKIIYYVNKAASPVVLMDNRIRNTDDPQFRNNSLIPVPRPSFFEGTRLQQLTAAHFFFQGFAYNATTTKA